ncbi:MAG: arginine--tRNA ligase [Patescibacteria group bacterium]
MVKGLIEKALHGAAGQYAGVPEYSVQFSDNPRNGHITTNCALVLAQAEKANPRELAEKIKSDIEKELAEIVEKIEIAGPGFINFFLKDSAIIAEIKEVSENIKNGFEFLKGRKINVEFISANPTGKLHIGHGRGAFYGDTLANVLSFSGAEVAREYYINDSRESNQIKELGKTALGKGEQYKTAEIDNIIALIPGDITEESEAGFKLAELVQTHNKLFIEEKLKINFDEWYSEDEKIRATKLNERTLLALKMKELTYEKDGAVWLKTSEYGDDEDRVLVRSDGTSSYFLSDISYHGDKFSRGYDTAVDVWGADHHGHVKRLLAAKKMLSWPGELRVFITQLVSIKEGDSSSKMSKRAGNVVLLEDLVNEFGLDVVRWFYNEKSLSTHMEFDAARAKEKTEKNPVFYVQYAHARICSILDKAKGLPEDITELTDVIKAPAARALALKIAALGEVVFEAARDFQVQRLTSYAYELASAFSGFYRDVRIIEGESYAKGAYELLLSAKEALSRTLGLLGISAPEKM